MIVAFTFGSASRASEQARLRRPCVAGLPIRRWTRSSHSVRLRSRLRVRTRRSRRGREDAATHLFLNPSFRQFAEVFSIAFPRVGIGPAAMDGDGGVGGRRCTRRIVLGRRTVHLDLVPVLSCTLPRSQGGEEVRATVAGSRHGQDAGRTGEATRVQSATRANSQVRCWLEAIPKAPSARFPVRPRPPGTFAHPSYRVRDRSRCAKTWRKRVNFDGRCGGARRRMMARPSIPELAGFERGDDPGLKGRRTPGPTRETIGLTEVSHVRKARSGRRMRISCAPYKQVLERTHTRLRP